MALCVITVTEYVPDHSIDFFANHATDHGFKVGFVLLGEGKDERGYRTRWR
jgi:hypothetical protein